MSALYWFLVFALIIDWLTLTETCRHHSIDTVILIKILWTLSLSSYVAYVTWKFVYDALAHFPPYWKAVVINEDSSNQ
jgi:hypothetical protein